MVIFTISLSFALVLPWRWVNPPISAFMLQHWWATRQQPKHEWLALRRISPHLQIAVIASEDQLFAQHFGFDLKMIADAMADEGGRRRGASTISQQVAKNLFLWSGRSYVRKGFEAWLTVFIEICWSKQRILEVYLNIAEFGRGIYGAGAASKNLFNKPANQLSLLEASLLAAVLPKPKWRRANKPSDYVLQRAGEIQAAVAELDGVRYLEQL